VADIMMPLFSKSGLIVLESLSFTKTLYAFDFDGTLARIVSTPAEARMSATTELLLKQLSNNVPTAIVSGRSVADLKRRIDCKPEYLIGNHGLEGLKLSQVPLKAAEDTCNLWRKALGRFEFESGIEIEDKTYSLAIHYRRARQKTKAKIKIKNVLMKLDPLPRIIPGKAVLNLVPSGAPHKGAAVLDLIKDSGMKHIFYIGDDDTDEDVFGLPYDHGQIMTVRVGKKKNSQAKYFIDRQFEINRLLKLLIKFHNPKMQSHYLEGER
jgi:trehalose 6-phosphate phosphatase